MKSWILRILGALVLVTGLGAAVLWTVLAVPYFSDMRRTFVADLLTQQLGQPVLVKGDVNVVLGTITEINAAGVQLPSETLDDVMLAELETLSFDVDLRALIDRKIDLDNLAIGGLQVQLLTTADGRTSWSASGGQAAPAPETAAPANTEPSQPDTAQQNSRLLAFLSTRTVNFSDIGLVVLDEGTGFEFDFLLSGLSLEQLDNGATLGVEGSGTVNDEAFDLVGRYPRGAPFTTRATFSGIELTFDGTPDAAGGYSAALDVQVAALGDLLEVFKLERVLEGAGALSAQVTRQDGVLSVSDLAASVALEKGQRITVSGAVADVRNVDGFDLSAGIRFHADGQAPAPATELKDIRLLEVTTDIISVDRKLELDRLLVTTNAFDQGLDKLGPIAIGRIRKTEGDQLAMENITVQAGPLDAPYLKAEGNILNVLQLEQLDIAGEVNLPASVVLKSLSADEAEAFGRLDAGFAMDDSAGQLSLTSLTAQARDTEVWALEADMQVGDVLSLDGFALDAALDVADGASFLTALNLSPVDAGPLRLSTSVRGNDGVISGDVGVGAGTSSITGTLRIAEKERRRIDVAIRSPLLAINDLKNAIAGVVELRKIGEATPDEPELQPLVLPEAEDPNLPELQPLVLPAGADIADPVAFLRETDIYGEIEFEQISGLQGVTQVSSEMKSEGGQASVGPLEFNYGGGYFRFGAEMDLVNTPDRVAVSGATDGWDLKEIVDELDINLDANGALSGRFDLAGRITSVQAFLNSMSGSARLDMGQGRISTSLLELAGLGIFPWLFSEELAQGYTDVTCIRAPVRISGSQVQFDRVVAETRSVQMFVRGQLDWTRDMIAIRAEPRPVGRPLARSAWPFDVTGQLTAPEFKLDVGGSRMRRSDGADQMPANRTPCEPDILQLQ